MKLKRILAFILLSSLLMCSLAVSASAEKYDFSTKTVDQVISEYMSSHGLNADNFSLGWYDTVSGDEWYYNQDLWLAAGSMYKLPIAMIITEKLEAGELKESDTIRNFTVSDALYKAIVNSDNDAAQALRQLISTDRDKYREALAQYSGIEISDLDKRFYTDNYMSPRFVIGTLKYFYEHIDRYPTVLEYMKQACEGEYFKASGVEYEIAHKYGSFQGELNDCGIIYASHPFLLTVFTKGVANSDVMLGELCALMTEYTDFKAASYAAPTPQPAQEPTPEITHEPEAQSEPEIVATAAPVLIETAESEAGEKRPIKMCTLTGYVCAVIMLMGMVYELIKRHRTRAVFSGILMLLFAVGAAITGLDMNEEDILPASAAVSPTATQAPAEQPAAETPAPVEETPVPVEEKTRWTLSFAGDCTIATLHEWQGSTASHNLLYKIGSDYDYCFKNVKQYFENDDFTIVNCEGSFTNETTPKQKDYRFRAPPEYAEVFTRGGIEAVSLANNHTVDYLEAGTQETKDTLDAQGLLWTDTDHPIITTLENGPKIGVISFNAVEIDLYVGDVDGYMSRLTPSYEQCVEENCDIIIAYIHWGWEYYTEPEVWMVDMGRRLVDLGCDIVIGDHAHVIQHVEMYNGTPIYYGMANFCYGGNSNPSDKDTVIIQQEILLNEDGSYSVGDATYIPCRISTTDETNDFCPTPYAQGTEAYNRVLTKLMVTQ